MPKNKDTVRPGYYNAQSGNDLLALLFALGIGEDFAAGSIAKYAIRYKQKGVLSDLYKAQVYLERLIAHLENQKKEKSNRVKKI